MERGTESGDRAGKRMTEWGAGGDRSGLGAQVCLSGMSR